MEQELRFGLKLGRLAILKKEFGPIVSNFWGRFFHVFVGKIFIFYFLKNIVASALKSYIILFFIKKKIEKKIGFFRAAQILKFECAT